MSKLDNLLQRKAEAELGGGTDKIQKQHDAGKKTARERMAMLFDDGSFMELDALATHRSIAFDMPEVTAPGEGVVTGYGTVDGRLVYAYAQDYTVIDGALGEMHAAKICKVIDLALKMGAPIVGMIDSGGARLQEGLDALKGFGDIFHRSSLASGVVPQISMILGTCAGGAVYGPALSDFVFMVDKTSQMFVNGPSVVKSLSGEDISFDDLGGAQVHAAKTGVATMACPTEEDCFLQVKKLLALLPANNLETAPDYDCNDDLNRMAEGLNTIIPEDESITYDVRSILDELADDNAFFELSEAFAPNMVTGFIRLNGRTVGVLGNQPAVLDGALDCDALDKGARFVRFCDSFNLPILTLTDAPGYVPGIEQEHGGLIRHGAKLLYAFSEATVPKINLVVKRAYGGAYITMNSKHLGADMVFAWPTAEIAVMPSSGAASILFRDEIAASADPVATRQEKIAAYKEDYASPYVAAARGYVDDVIVPAETRPRLISAFEMLLSKRDSRPAKKHGTMPL